MEGETRSVEAALRPIASLMTARQGPARYGDLKPVLRSVAAENEEAPDAVALLETLNDLGVIWETADDRWEMGIPGFARYILKRTTPRP